MTENNNNLDIDLDKEALSQVEQELFTIQRERESAYVMIKQGPITNALSRVSDKTPAKYTGLNAENKIINITNGQTDVKIMIEKFANTKLSISTSKLLRIIEMKYSDSGRTTIEIPLEEYMEYTGRKDEKEARKNLKTDLNTLWNISCKAKSTDHNGKTIEIDFRVLDAKANINNSIINVHLGCAIASYLNTCTLMPYHKKLLSISNHYPYAYYLGDKITEQKKYHMYDDSFQVSVKTLIDICIANGLPTYEEVKNTCRRIEKRIIEPFEKNLDYCNEVFEWEYCNAKGVPLTEEQLADNSYGEFINRYIRVTFKDYKTGEYNPKKANKKKKVTKKKTSK